MVGGTPGASRRRVRWLQFLLFAAALTGCSTSDGPDAGTDAGRVDGAPDASRSDGGIADAAIADASPPDLDGGGWWDAGPPIDGCTPGPLASGLVRSCIPFPSGVRVHDLPEVVDSFGALPPPADAELDDQYQPRDGECSIATHDRYWVRAQDGRVYRTWHPPNTTDAETGAACSFGHEHGDDPRTSPLYQWAGGVPFGIVNHVAGLAGFTRHEDHFGHKVVVQDLWQAVIGNPPGPDDEPIAATGFHCYWLSKVHQGTHSGDALGNNMHEYQNNVMCDDGAVRTPDSGREQNAGPAHHTETSVKTLTFWGQPGWFKSCSGLARQDAEGTGIEPPEGSDTNREIKCARAGEGWTYKELPTQVTSATGHVDFAPRDAGIDELWKPWSIVTDREGRTIFTSSAYYVVRNPIRLFNDGSLVPRRDVDGDGTLDSWIPTIEACLAIPPSDRFGQCRDLPTFPPSVPMTEWWRQPESPFNGTIRVIHPKRIDLFNPSDRSIFCTDHLGQETADDPTVDTTGAAHCPAGQLLQRVAATQNLWFGAASWASGARGSINGSMVNARSATQGAGYGHEWVRFFNAPGVHAPN